MLYPSDQSMFFHISHVEPTGCFAGSRISLENSLIERSYCDDYENTVFWYVLCCVVVR